MARRAEVRPRGPDSGRRRPGPPQRGDPTIPHLEPLVRTALDAADAAAAVHRRWAGHLRMDRASEKGRSDFVSRADLEAQDAVVALIRERHPDHEILAEEGDPDVRRAARGDDSTPVWVVDPLDGTTNFLHRHPMYAASVAVARGGRPVAGAVACSATGERWWAARGGGAWKDGRPIRVSSIDRLADALVGTGFPFKAQHMLPTYLTQFAATLRSGAGIRRGGAAALDLCYLADGRFDAFWELFLNPWDFAAGMLVAEEAGGVVTNLDGDPLPLEPGGVLAANSAELLGALAALLEGADG